MNQSAEQNSGDQPSVKLTDRSEEELKRWAIEHGYKPFRAKQLFQWVYWHRVDAWDEMSNLPRAFRQEISQSFSIKPITLVNQKIASDGTVKYLQELHDGYHIESVLMNHGDYHALCVSTQVGCAMACKFCLTAGMGLERNLTPGEIVDQILNAYRLLSKGELIRNIVYMGMGEPFHNYDNTIKSLEILTSPGGLNFSSRRVTISTSGVVPGIKRFAQEKKVKANLAISLNGVTQEARKELMPISKRYSLEKLIQACREFPTESRKRITFEYILVDGLTDSPQAAREFVKLLHGIKSKVNLIPYNENDQLSYKSPQDSNIKQFRQYLLDHGIVATLRKTRGQGISAACGQLATERRAR